MSISTPSSFDPAIFAYQIDASEDHNSEICAENLAQNQEFTLPLFSETEASVVQKISDFCKSCEELKKKEKRIISVSKILYRTALLNSSIGRAFEEVEKDINALLGRVQKSSIQELIKKAQSAKRLLDQDKQVTDEKLSALKWQLAEVKNCRRFDDVLFSQQLQDLAKASQSESLAKKIAQLSSIVLSQQSVMTEVGTHMHALVLSEIAFRQRKASTTTIRHPVVLRHFKPLFAATEQFLQKIIISDIRLLDPRRLRSKREFKNILSKTLADLRKENSTVPSWKKLSGFQDDKLKSLISSKFLSIFWDSYFSREKEAAFAIESFAEKLLESCDSDSLLTKLQGQEYERQVEILGSEVFANCQITSFTKIRP